MGYTAMMTLKRYANVLVLLDFMVRYYQNIYSLHLAIVSTAVLYMQTY